MVKGKAMTPVPHGVISTSTGPVDPVDEAIKEADAEEATEEYVPDEEIDQA
jgi:hypothetical protein